MSSRDQILSRVKANKPPQVKLPDVAVFEQGEDGAAEKFTEILNAIGGGVYYVDDYQELLSILRDNYPDHGRIYSPIPDVKALTDCVAIEGSSGHQFADVEWAVIKGHFGVAENGAIWITGDLMEYRSLPFICQRLAIIIKQNDILPTMHDAYRRIGDSTYSYGAFIAGPSKTADIEQSLVLGAHGPKGMAVFIMKDDSVYS
ncbi:lactate utilization protein B/C [Mucilaginibacter limnophilus]|uniref:Lactate utilization protein B/C n=1 Tax=Mucilaginibacter limnophilus TaxID=1932778 RepID=A0A3S2Y5B3_9SPHI|nr:LUD domain-containing protein [Mucilaginibacter limnophilus]RVU02413.1 lactate utilization protein B/C [Mucilaginibacter limnophilus]